jgi:hypothetical protein
MREARRLTPEERAERVRVRQLRVFYSHVTPGPDGHLLWTGARFVGRDGQPTYGMSHYGGDTHTAHSAVWRIEVGEIPTGWDVDHDEGCPKNCVNVAHLSLLSHSVHGRKSWARGLERKRQKARMRLLAKFAVGLVKIEEDG